MVRVIVASIRALAVLTVITGLCYPLAITGLANFCFPDKAEGSLIRKNGKIFGSTLIAQDFKSDRYFKSRPSGTDYATVPSGASNLSPTSKALQDAVQQRKSVWGPDAPADLLTASASGLDPHISVQSARLQIKRIAKARGLSSQQADILKDLVSQSIEQREVGFLGPLRVNVTKLNFAIDERIR